MKGTIAFALLAGVLFVFPWAVDAAAVNLGLTPAVGGALGLGTQDIRVTIAKIIRNLFGLLGIVAVVIVLYGGFLYMTSQGEEGQIDKAKKVIMNGVIGLAIILSAVGITQFIISRLVEATGYVGGGGPGGGGPGYIPKSGSLGQGIIESHFPERGATGVPRNTRVVITFKQKIDLTTLIRGFDYNDPASSTKHDLEDANVSIYPTKVGLSGALKSTEVQVYYTPDERTFVFRVPLLGSPTEDVPYIVSLKGGDLGIHKIEGGKSVPAFDGAFASGYEWDFTTGTFIDSTPPRVESVVPYSASLNPRNTLIQVNFSEAIDPTTVSGKLPNFKNLEVYSGAAPGAPVEGSFRIGNRYRTIEFISTDLCGTNACGGDVYCLPGNVQMTTVVKAATLGLNPPEADPTKFPADGVTDMVGNSLDGNGNGTAEGPGAGPDKDDYSWGFSTDDTIDLTPPVITEMTPGKDAPKVMVDKPVEANFSKLMSLVSFDSTSVALGALPPPPEPTCYTLSGDNLDQYGNVSTSTPPVNSKMRLSHCIFYPETNYIPSISSKVMDVRQNCYLPGASQNLPTCAPSVMAAGGYNYCCNGKACKSACQLSGATVKCPD